MGGLTGSVDKLHLNLVIGVRILIKGLGTHYTFVRPQGPLRTAPQP